MKHIITILALAIAMFLATRYNAEQINAPVSQRTLVILSDMQRLPDVVARECAGNCNGPVLSITVTAH